MAALVQLFWGRVASAVSALNATFALVQSAVQKSTKITVYVTFNAATTAGTFVVEAAPDPNYTGAWATLATIAWSAATKTEVAVVNGPHRAVRVRCSVAVVGGNADIDALIGA